MTSQSNYDHQVALTHKYAYATGTYRGFLTTLLIMLDFPQLHPHEVIKSRVQEVLDHVEKVLDDSST